MAIRIVNNGVVDGSFDYDVELGHIFFRMTNSFYDTTIGDEVVVYIILSALHTIDKYNDKLLLLSKGMISLEKFIEQENS
ncbi:MAG: hypothetical protein IJA35_06360 [Clostridia bacterium]|nr:hypothetical protein [Clostridia bacterium]